MKTNPAKHKTELCKTYSELGYCPYDRKCRFAHGKQELVTMTAKPTLKSRKCNGFWKNGCCSYGMRCQFGHAELTWEGRAALLGFEAICQAQPPKVSKLLQKLGWRWYLLIFYSQFLNYLAYSKLHKVYWTFLIMSKTVRRTDSMLVQRVNLKD